MIEKALSSGLTPEMKKNLFGNAYLNMMCHFPSYPRFHYWVHLPDCYYEEERINEYGLTLFIRDEDASCAGRELYRKYQETHYQRGYTLEEIKDLLRSSGLEYVTAYDAFTRDAPGEESERIYVIARESGKADNR